jgi:hypothetical protein
MDYPSDCAQDRADALACADDFTYRERLNMRLATYRPADRTEDNSALRARRDVARWRRNLTARDDSSRLFDGTVAL